MQRCKETQVGQVTLYRSMIRSILYLTTSRLDIAFSVGICARFQSDPKKSHLFAVKRIIKYVSGTTNFGLWYTYDTNSELVGFSDANWVGYSDDRKSTSREAFYVATTLLHSIARNKIMSLCLLRGKLCGRWKFLHIASLDETNVR